MNVECSRLTLVSGLTTEFCLLWNVQNYTLNVYYRQYSVDVEMYWHVIWLGAEVNCYNSSLKSPPRKAETQWIKGSMQRFTERHFRNGDCSFQCTGSKQSSTILKLHILLTEQWKPQNITRTININYSFF